MTLALSVCVLAGTIRLLGTSAPLMQRQFLRYAPPQMTGLPEADYPGMAQTISAYLRGDAAECQYALNGAAVFHDYELRHMADCLTLFELDRRVLLVSALLLAVCVPAALLLRRGRETAMGMALSGGVQLALVGAVGVIGAVDFDRLFILFHQLSFDNSLWLLDPSTDMLIRLMPTAFFVSYAGMLLAAWLGALILMTAAGLAVRRTHKR